MTPEEARRMGVAVEEPVLRPDLREAFAQAARRRPVKPAPGLPAWALKGPPAQAHENMDDSGRAEASEVGGDPGASEVSEQEALATWLDAAGALWCHVPNGGHRHRATAAALKAQGVKAGVPDVLIFTQLAGLPDARGVALELKRPGARPKRALKSGTWPACVRPEQREWLAALAAQGWVALVAFGADDAIAQLEELGFGGEGEGDE